MTEKEIVFLEDTPIHNAVYSGDACTLPVDEVAKMPMNSNTLYHVATREPGQSVDTLTPVMIAKYEAEVMNPMQKYMKEVLRIVPGDDQDFIMEAFVFDVPLMRLVTADLLKDIKNSDVMIGFNFMTKKNGKHHPAIHAKQFVPWALKVLEKDRKVDYILTNNEPGSDTLEQFKSHYHLPEKPDAESVTQAKIFALQHTWTYSQLVQNHFELVPGDSIRFIFTEPGKPPSINALYRRTSGLK